MLFENILASVVSLLLAEFFIDVVLYLVRVEIVLFYGIFTIEGICLC